MRISTQNMFDTSIATLQRRQEQMQEAQQRLTSGKRIEKASDDPTGASRAERASTAIGKAEANQRALEASRNAMLLSESALGDASEMLQQIRESMVAAGNASYSDGERFSLANKLVGLRNQLLGIANRPDGSGGYLFGGQGSGEPPFLDDSNGVRYTGVPGTVNTGSAEQYPLTVDGRQTWLQARTGNGTFETLALPNAGTGAPAKAWIDAGRVTNPQALTGHTYQVSITDTGAGPTYSVLDVDSGSVVASGSYIPGKNLEFDGLAVGISGPGVDGDRFEIRPSVTGQSLFNVLDRTIAELKVANRTPTQIAQANSAALRDIDAVMGNLQSVRSQVGETLSNLDGSENRLAALKLYSQTERSAAEDLDMVEGISEFQNQQSGYDAALKTYAMVQRMSLFQYLNG